MVAKLEKTLQMNTNWVKGLNKSKTMTYKLKEMRGTIPNFQEAKAPPGVQATVQLK